MLNFSLQLKVGNREVSDSEFVRALQEAAISSATEHIKQQVESIRCPVHNQTAKEVSAVESGEGRQTFDVACCCEALRAEIEKAFAE
jgi:hypothetical protein